MQENFCGKILTRKAMYVQLIDYRIPLKMQ